MFRITKVDGKTVMVGTVKVGDTEQEVTAPLPEGVYTSEQVKETFVPKKDWQRRANKFAETQLDAALQDETFKARAMETWGIKPGEASQGPTAEQLKQLQTNWMREHVEPLKAQNQTLAQQVQTLQSKGLHAEILAAANELGFRDYLVKPAGEGQDPMILGMMERYFGHDPDSNGWYVRDGDGYALASNPTANQTYKGVREYLADFAQNNPAVLDDKRQRGPSVTTGQQGGKPDINTQIAEAEKAGDFHTANALKAQQLSAM